MFADAFGCPAGARRPTRHSLMRRRAVQAAFSGNLPRACLPVPVPARTARLCPGRPAGRRAAFGAWRTAPPAAAPHERAQAPAARRPALPRGWRRDRGAHGLDGVVGVRHVERVEQLVLARQPRQPDHHRRPRPERARAGRERRLVDLGPAAPWAPHSAPSGARAVRWRNGQPSPRRAAHRGQGGRARPCARSFAAAPAHAACTAHTSARPGRAAGGRREPRRR